MSKNQIAKTDSLPVFPRTGEGLRDLLFDEIDRLRAGGDRRRALAVAELAKQVIKAAWLEIEFARCPAANQIPSIRLGKKQD